MDMSTRCSNWKDITVESLTRYGARPTFDEDGDELWEWMDADAKT